LFSIVLNYEALSAVSGPTVAQAEEPVAVAELVPGDDAVALVLGIAD
jgi:hypothetical protein